MGNFLKAALVGTNNVPAEAPLITELVARGSEELVIRDFAMDKSALEAT